MNKAIFISKNGQILPSISATCLPLTTCIKDIENQTEKLCTPKIVKRNCENYFL